MLLLTLDQLLISFIFFFLTSLITYLMRFVAIITINQCHILSASVPLSQSWDKKSLGGLTQLPFPGLLLLSCQGCLFTSVDSASCLGAWSRYSICCHYSEGFLSGWAVSPFFSSVHVLPIKTGFLVKQGKDTFEVKDIQGELSTPGSALWNCMRACSSVACWVYNYMLRPVCSLLFVLSHEGHLGFLSRAITGF